MMVLLSLGGLAPAEIAALLECHPSTVRRWIGRFNVRASWTRRGIRPQVCTPGKNRQVTVFGALEVTTGRWAYRLGRRRAADFIRFPDQLLRTFPRAPAIAVMGATTTASNTPRRSPPTWSAILAWNCCTAPATARMTARPRCGCLSASCVGLLFHGYRAPCVPRCRSGCRCRSSGAGCGSRPAAGAARGGVRFRRGLR